MKELEKINPVFQFKTGNLIDDFVLDTQWTESPELFRKWSAISLISGFAQRRIYVDIGKGELYPNQYILLVSPPGIGKSIVINIIEDLWKAEPKIHIGKTRQTLPGLIDDVSSASSYTEFKGAQITTHPLVVAPREYGTWMQSFDLSTLNVLNDLWDSPREFSEMSRSQGKNAISYPNMVLLSGTQPSYLNNVLPEEAWTLGFCSRLILAYDYRVKVLRTSERKNLPTFPREKYEGFLKSLVSVKGELIMSPDAEEFMDSWVIDLGMKPIPMHPRLHSYTARRQVHWLKTAMCRALAEGSVRIELRHMEQAKADLLELEMKMPEIFQEMTRDSDASILDELRLWLMLKAKPKDGKPGVISEHILIQYLLQKISPQRIGYFIENIIHAKYIIETENPSGLTQYGNKGYRWFKVGADISKKL